MTPSPSGVRPVLGPDEPAWRRLWDGYLTFYGVALDPGTTDDTWRRLLDPDSAMQGVVAERDGRLAGFALYLLHEGSWSRRPTCHLEDLFVAPDARRQGVGRSLIGHLADLGRAQGWSSIYWHTQASNERARRLYDTIATTEGFVRYRLPILS